MERIEATPAGHRLIENVERVVKGDSACVELAVTSLLAGGHLLIEGVPGVGKTMLARALATSVGGTLKRVQATPDLMPSDITGISIYNQRTEQFEFVPGPVFANVVLVDEINRTPPRTQSSLMEAMEESRVTVEGTSYDLPDPFFLIATQNPTEHHGTYPLPEGQLDRFALSIAMGQLGPEVERLIVRSQLHEHPIEGLRPVLWPEQIAAIRERVRHQHVSEAVLDYVLALVQATRGAGDIQLGVSARGTTSLVRLAQARALLHDRDYVLPDDIKALAMPALVHRLVLRGGAADPGDRRILLEGILRRVPVPVRVDREHVSAAG